MSTPAQRVLVTGATGFLGQHLMAWLLSQGCHVMATSIPGDPLLAYLPDGVRGFAFDIRDEGETSRVLHESRPDVVFHLAALLRSRDLGSLLSVNVAGTDSLLSEARNLKTPPKVIIPGSASEYGVPEGRLPFDERSDLRPISAYGVSKAAQTLTGLSYALRGDLPVVVGRIFNMSGPGEPESMLCGAMASQITAFEASGTPGVLHVGNLAPYRDYLDVRDVVRALWHLWLRGESGTVYNISSGVARQVQDVVEGLVAKARVPVTLEPDPTRQRPSDIPYCCGDATRLRTGTGWVAHFSLAQTLTDTLEDWRGKRVVA